MPNRRTVLCVDDNAAHCDNLREILEDEGYAVRVAGCCADAMARAEEGFDVALVDVRLPDGDGVAFAGRLREVAPDAQVIMLTGHATIESAVAAVRAGAWAYLMKPCSTPNLLVAVEQAVRQVEHLEERNELMRRTRVAEKLAAIGTLTAGISHEIKNPLNAAALQLALLGRRIRRLPPDVQPALEGPLKLVQDEITRLNRILEGFLEFARPRQLVKGPVDVTALLARVADLLGPQAEAAGVRLERDWDGAMAPVIGEEGRLQQAVMNLVLNAIQATPRGGHVRIDGRQTERGVLVAVEDSGPGVPDEIRHRIFEPFFTTKAGGSGLGLPMVHTIVEQHGGAVSAERRATGGSRFVIRLPIA